MKIQELRLPLSYSIIKKSSQNSKPTAMATKVFINLPIKDVARSREFFSKLGFSFNEQFCDEKAFCMVLSEGHSYVMMLQEDFFKTFTKKEIADSNKTTEVLIALETESREAVDEMVQKALTAGGTKYRDTDDHGWMYQSSFADLDGHQWEVCYMDEAALAQQMSNQPETAVG